LANTGFMTKPERKTKRQRRVGVEIGDRPRRDAAVHRRLGDRRRDAQDQPRIERARDQRVRPEAPALAAVGRATTSDGGSRASSAMASTAASFISSLIVVAPTSSAPRKMNGKHRTLLTWFG
jgi:hypothetical protein